MKNELLIAVLFGVVMVLMLLWPNVSVHAYTRPTTIRQMILEKFPPVMLRVAIAESGLNPTATNKTSTAKGLFQILDGTWKNFGCTGDPFNASDNIACAVKIYAKDGTSDWNASKSIWSAN